jgi:hypothetical protein
MSPSVVSGLCAGGYAPGMSDFEMFLNEVEVSITDSVQVLDQQEAAQLYAGILDVESRLDALRDALTLLSTRS